jgi:hypothetical protein
MIHRIDRFTVKVEHRSTQMTTDEQQKSVLICENLCASHLMCARRGQSSNHELLAMNLGNQFTKVSLASGLSLLPILIFLMVFFGCGEAPPPPTPSPTAGAINTQPVTSTFDMDPAAGYAGTRVNVRGSGWQPATMITIKLTDAQGRSPVLTAVTSNAAGDFQTSFLYPYYDRWLGTGPHTVVAATTDETITITQPFTVAPPGSVVTPTTGSKTWMPLIRSAANTPTSTFTPTIAVEPSPARVNGEVRVQGGGFPANTPINIYLAESDPGGDPRQGRYIYIAAATDQQGEYQGSLTIPATWLDGTPLSASNLVVTVATPDFSVRTSTALRLTPAVTPSPGPTPLPSVMLLPPTVAAPVAATSPTPPEVQAGLVTLDCTKNRTRLRVAVSGLAEDGSAQAVAVLKVAAIETKREPRLKVADEPAVRVKGNRFEVQGPAPEALLAQLQTYGGLIVKDGQVLEVRHKPAAAQRFVLERRSWQIEAPAVELQVIAADGTVITEATAPIGCAGDRPDENHNNEDDED